MTNVHVHVHVGTYTLHTLLVARWPDLWLWLCVYRVFLGGFWPPRSDGMPLAGNFNLL